MALSAFLADSAQTDSWRNAFDHAIPKPAGRDELRAAIQAILDSRLDQMAPQNEEPLLPKGTEPIVDWDVASEIQSHIPRAQWLEIVMTAETEIMACISVLRTDLASPAKRAHKIKGIAASFGLLRLAAEAQQIESCRFGNLRDLKKQADEIMTLAVLSTDHLRAHNGTSRDLRHA